MAGSLETNKLIGAVLTAGIIAVASGVIADLLYRTPTLEQAAYPLLGDDTETAEADAEPEPTVPLPVLLADASAEAGERAFRACAACHTVESGGANRVGPNLWGVLGRDIATKEDFRYSDVLSDKEGEWTYDNLDGFLAAPNTWAPGTSMSYAGISGDEARADMIVYLRSLADDPMPLPDPEAEAEGEGESGQGR